MAKKCYKTSHMPQKSLSGFVDTACNYDPTEDLIPFVADGVLVGWVKPGFAEKLKDWPDVFIVRPRGVSLSGDYANCEQRSAALGEVTETLAVEGVLSGWRDELVTVAETFHSEPIFHIERAASRNFGLLSYAAHLNGLTVRDGVPLVWIARRSHTKSIDPDRLDNLVGGCISRGSTPLQTLHKECWEEAGIGADMAATARAAGAVGLCYQVEEGVHRELIFVHDLFLPPDFEPRNQDGEVSGFLSLAVGDVIARVEAMSSHGEFTIDSAIVMVDYLIRRGFLTSERKDYIELLRSIKP
jgi:8-oxo-dGTP pyrophosphatase MutT (NUDIX family)